MNATARFEPAAPDGRVALTVGQTCSTGDARRRRLAGLADVAGTWSP